MVGIFPFLLTKSFRSDPFDFDFALLRAKAKIYIIYYS